MNSFVADFISRNHRIANYDLLKIRIACICNQSSAELNFFVSPPIGGLQRECAKFLLFAIDASSGLLVAGIEALLYEQQQGKAASRLFIKHVDTTGYLCEVARLLVKALVAFVGAPEVNLLSLPQPFYLFPGSHLSSAKKILTSDRLVEWWLACLGDAYKQIEIFSPNQASTVFPFEEENCPLFPGDVKSHHLQALGTCSFSTFKNSFCLREEFQKENAFLIKASQLCSTLRQASSGRQWQESGTSISEILCFLQACSFENTKSAQMATSSLLELIPPACITELCLPQGGEATPRKRSLPAQTVVPTNIQSLIKRKK